MSTHINPASEEGQTMLNITSSRISREREGSVEKLYTRMAATLIQTWLRVSKQRRDMAQLRGVVVVQKLWRGHAGRQHSESRARMRRYRRARQQSHPQRRSATVLLQKIWRAWAVRQQTAQGPLANIRARLAAVTLAQQMENRLQQTRGALMAQKLWRGREARNRRPIVRCQICADTELLIENENRSASSMVHNARFVLDSVTTPNDDTLREDACQHDYCMGCVRTYLVTEIMENSRSGMMCCPSPECNNRFLPPDVEEILTVSRTDMVKEGTLLVDTQDPCLRALTKYNELLTADYDARLRDILNTTDIETQFLLFRKSRLCPGCKVILTRNGGCPDFHCSCGENFHYWTAPRVMHHQWKGASHSYSQVLECATKHDMSIVESISLFVSQKKRTVGKLRVLLQQHSRPPLGWGEIEAFAHAAMMGEADACAAINVARDNKLKCKQQRLKDKAEGLTERIDRRRQARRRSKMLVRLESSK